MEINKNEYKIDCENGYYIFKLETLLKEMEKSKYALSKATSMDHKLINRYAKGDLTRFDLKVIARICDYCDCNIESIVEYFPNSQL